ncbi:30S ribosomal protein S2 [Candidatus Uhrbacteria bacterium]|nr:30S ribosomal protein S2 [Candidatus Uhrbacteria bacterium]
MPAIPSLEELLRAGVHFGHRESRHHPKMDPYLFGVRNTVHVIDLEKTREKLQVACDAAKALGRDGKTILFVGTKDQAKPLIREAAMRVGMPYVIGRWLGGTITNFPVISKVIQKYRSLTRSRDTGETAQKYTKFEQSQINQEIARLEEAVGGIAELHRLPDALFIIDIHEEETAVREAKRKGITTFAICDSNVDPTQVTYPIPGNDDATSSIQLLVRVFTDAVAEGMEERAREMARAEAAQPTAAQ